MKMSANACRTIGSSELRMVAAPCVSMSIRTSTPFCQIRQYRFAQCAVKIFVHFRVLQKIASIDACMKICVERNR